MNWLRKALGLCNHKWAIEATFEEIVRSVYSDRKRIVGRRYVLRCEHCGEIKVKEISV